MEKDQYYMNLALQEAKKRTLPNFGWCCDFQRIEDQRNQFAN